MLHRNQYHHLLKRTIQTWAVTAPSIATRKVLASSARMRAFSALYNNQQHPGDNLYPNPRYHHLKNNNMHMESSIRSFSKARDSRTAGRKRFYKIVNIQPTLPPWELGKDENEKAKSIDSPISAGVDNSPSGVLKKSINNIDDVPLQQQHLLSIRANDNDNDDDDDNDDEKSKSSWYTITLDNRPLRTPAGNPLSLPSLSLSLAIASEWDAQKTHLNPTQMPLMTLACTAIDQTATYPAYTEIQENCMKYLFNDTTCYFADPSEDRVLYRKQMKYWDKIHDFIATHLLEDKSVRPAVAIGHFDGMLLSRRKDNEKAAGLPHPPVLIEKVQNYLKTLNAWELTCLQTCTMEAKSLLVALSILKSVGTATSTSSSSSKDNNKKSKPQTCFDGKIKDFIIASRVEEEFQIENWGLVEGGHDYDRLNCSVQITAATFMLQSIRDQL